MILQLLGALALSGLNALSTQQNAFNISNSSDGVDGGYSYTYITGSYDDFFDLGGWKFIGFDLDIEQETGETLYNDLYTSINDFNNRGGASDNPSLMDYILSSDTFYDRFDLFAYTGSYVYNGTYYYSINWYYGDYFKLERVITTFQVLYRLNSSTITDVNMYATEGFPYSLKNLSYYGNGEEGYVSNHSYYCDTFSPFSLLNGGASDGEVDNTYGWRNLYPVNYGYYWTMSQQYTYTQITFKNQYQKGIENDYYQGYHNGYVDGYDSGSAIGHQQGFSEGVQYAQNLNSTALTIFTGIINVALIPINFFLACLNFEVFGINIGGAVSALLTVCIIIIIVRMITGNKSTGE